jgi:peptidylprolyl isomerase
MRRGAVTVLAITVLLTTAACGSSSTTDPSASTSASTATALPSPVADALMPTVVGGFGTTPKISFPVTPAPTTLQAKVLTQGTGAAVPKGDLLLANYVGQIWNGKVFDSSFTRGEPAGFAIGVDKVIAGWDETLVGQKVGTRVLLSIPPDKGYGANGNSSAGITATDTLVFVVDILASYPVTSAGDPAAVPQTQPATGPQVGGALGAKPTISIPAGTAEPTKISTTVIAKGTGAAVKAGTLVMQFVAIEWTGKDAGSTWADGAPAALTVGGKAGASAFAGVVGLPLGSRVLIQIPADAAAGQAAAAAVVDLVAQP